MKTRVKALAIFDYWINIRFDGENIIQVTEDLSLEGFSYNQNTDQIIIDLVISEFTLWIQTQPQVLLKKHPFDFQKGYTIKRVLDQFNFES
ncbi:hypothetical protein ACFL0K_01625 [Patescibacteria group bacterium]